MTPSANEIDPTPTEDRPSTPSWFWAAWAVSAAFGAYFCMYAFRKPFTAAAYAEPVLWGVDFKTLLVISQVLGYALSKVIGVKVVSEMLPQRRAAGMLGLILWAELALVGFGLTPRPWNACFLFLNGLSLGMVFGLVLGFLEGRRSTELLAAGLCASFVLADGVTKSAGSWLLSLHVTEDWMPAAAGAMFLLPFALFTAMLARLPAPTTADVGARSERQPMTAKERRRFFSRHGWGLAPILVLYLLMTVVRSMRADFAPEIWKGLQFDVNPATFTLSEAFVAFGVLAVNAAVVFISDNRRAFFVSLATCFLGLCTLAAALVFQQHGMLDGFSFMVLAGLGVYLPYIAVHTTVFERLIAMTRERANLGFLMSTADSVGYFGYVGVLLAGKFLPTPPNALGLLTNACWFSIVVSTICLLISWRYFAPLQSTQTVGDPSPAVVEVT